MIVSVIKVKAVKRHRAEYSRHSADLDATVRGIYNQHGYIVGSLRTFGGYGKHSPNRSAI